MNDCEALLIEKDQFLRLPVKEQMGCLYQNQVATLRLIEGYKFYQKLSAVIGSFLVLGIGILFKLHL